MLRSRSGLSSAMIGRAEALHAVTALVERARTAPVGIVGAGTQPAIALVSGDAGVGKTRLLRELTTHLDPSVVVLAGQAQPGSLGQPYQLVRDLLGDVDLRTDDGVAATVTAATDAILARIGARPGLVIIEDLHWADAGSVAVLARLATSAPATVVLVVSYRADEITQRLPGGELLAHLERTHPVVSVPLHPLRRTDVAAFLASVYGRPMPSAVIDTLMARTGGNPFFLEELIHASGSVDPDRLADQPLPWSLADLVARELDGVAAEERCLIETVAVVGNGAPFDALAHITGHDEATLITQLRSLVGRGLLVEDDEDDFSFRHALVRDAVLHQMLGRERRRLHATALDALRAIGSCDLAGLAHHAAGAGRWDDLVELAREGVPFYLERGSTHQALRLATDALGEAPDDLVLLAGATRAAWLLGLPTEAVGYGERWRDVARRAGHADDEAAALRMLSRLFRETFDEARLRPLIDELETMAEARAPGVERARLLAAVAQAHMLADRTGPAVAYAERAIAEADAAGAKDVRAQAKIELGAALALVPDRLDEGLRTTVEGIDEAEAVGDWVLVSRGLNNSISYVPLERFAEVEAITERLDAAAARAGFDAMSSVKCASFRCEAAFTVADRAAARRQVQRLAEGTQRATRDFPHGGEGHLALLEAEGGDLGAARALMQQIEANPELRSHAMEWLLPELARFVGDPSAAIESLSDFVRPPLLARLWFDPTRLHTRVESALVAGAPVDVVEAALAPLRAVGHAWLDGALVPADAELALARGDHQRVLDLLGDGTTVLDRPIGEARSRARFQYLRAQALAALGHRTDALDAARAAAAELANWPGVRADEVARLVERLEGVTSTQLTGRELEVASKVAEGLTNAEVARLLYISPKTAAVHVSNILTKLGATNRAEIAAWYVRNHGSPTR